MSRTRLLAVALLVFVAAAGWLGWQAWRVHAELASARAALTGAADHLQGHDVQALDPFVAQARRHTAAARRHTDGLLWRGASHVPVLGRSFEIGSAAADISDALVNEVVPPARLAAGRLADRPLLSSGTVDLAALQTIQQPLETADRAGASIRRRAMDMPQGWVPGPVARQRDDLRKQVVRFTDGLNAAAAATRLAPDLLGAGGPRRFFIAVQNPAESRGTGGLIGAYAVIRADNGRLSREKVGTDRDFRSSETPVVDLGSEFAAQYDGYSSRAVWSSVGITPDWPSAAAVIAGLWKAQGGGHLDGVIALDPLVMADVLRVTGAVTVDGRRIDASNVTDFVMRDEYAAFEHSDDARKRFLGDLAGDMFESVTSGRGGTSPMVAALSTAASSGHLQVWSARQAEEAVLRRFTVAGALPTERGAFLEVVQQNAAGNKIDYYLHRRVTYRRTGAHRATVAVALTNTVKAIAVPAIVTGRLDRPGSVTKGQTRLILSFFVGVGQRVLSVNVDGTPAVVQTGREKGHGWATTQVEVPVGQPVLVQAVITDPGGPLHYRQQPLAHPDDLDLRDVA